MTPSKSEFRSQDMEPPSTKSSRTSPKIQNMDPNLPGQPEERRSKGPGVDRSSKGNKYEGGRSSNNRSSTSAAPRSSVAGRRLRDDVLSARGAEPVSPGSPNRSSTSNGISAIRNAIP
jgi:hypothetical protein